MKTKQKELFLFRNSSRKKKFIKSWKDDSNEGICPGSISGNLRVEDTVTLSSDINHIHAMAYICPHTN